MIGIPLFFCNSVADVVTVFFIILQHRTNWYESAIFYVLCLVILLFASKYLAIKEIKYLWLFQLGSSGVVPLQLNKLKVLMMLTVRGLVQPI